MTANPRDPVANGERGEGFATLGDRLLRGFSALAAACLLALALLQFGIIAGRMLTPLDYLWMQEAVVYLHAATVVLAIAWTFRRDRHVRVDVVSERLTPALQKWLTVVFCILAACASLWLLYLCVPYAASSWAIGEGSREVGGLPGIFIIKSLLPLLALLLTIAIVLRLRAFWQDEDR